MIHHFLFGAIIALAVAGTASADQASPKEKRDTTPLVQEGNRPLGAGITIIRLKYADAEELAATLAPILPEGVKIVPYPPLNALIITRQPAGPQPSRP